MSGRLLITGASGGLGRALTASAASAGWTVIAASRDEKAIEELASSGVNATAVDVSTQAGARAAIEFCKDNGGVPDALVNCAGQVLIRPAHRTTEDEYRECMRANIDTAFFALQAFVDARRKEGNGGAAVLVSTVAALIGVQNHEAVAASKSAVEGLVRSAAATYASKHIRINSIAPGLVETPATRELMSNDVTRKALAKQYPLGRFGQPDDLVGAILWLLSDQAQWITGQVLPIDGGFTSIRPMVK